MKNQTPNQILENAAQNIAIIATDLNGVITVFNPGAEKLLGYQGHHVIANESAMLFHKAEEIAQQKTLLSKNLGIPIDDFGVFKEPALNQQEIPKIWTYVHKDGTTHRIQLNVSVIHNHQGESSGLLFMAIPFNSTPNSLTDISSFPNQYEFKEKLNIELRRMEREKNPISVLIIDMDYSKTYRDRYGDKAYSQCLHKIGHSLIERLKRAGDFFSYDGTDSFYIFLPNTDVPGSVKLAETLRLMVQTQKIPNESSKIGKYVTISIGIFNCTPKKETTTKFIIDIASEALRLAKSEGRNCSRII